MCGVTGALWGGPSGRRGAAHSTEGDSARAAFYHHHQLLPVTYPTWVYEENVRVLLPQSVSHCVSWKTASPKVEKAVLFFLRRKWPSVGSLCLKYRLKEEQGLGEAQG